MTRGSNREPDVLGRAGPGNGSVGPHDAAPGSRLADGDRRQAVPPKTGAPVRLPEGSPIVSPIDPADAGVLVGRDRERRLLCGLIDSLNVGGGAVVILGEAGMGKTSLLGSVGNCAKRHGVQVHILRGMESEAVIPFVAITDLLWPLRSYMASLPTIQREALEVCPASRVCGHARSSCLRRRRVSACDLDR